MVSAITRLLQSPANWCGLGLATLAMLLSGAGLAQWGGAWGTLGLAVLGYGTGFGVGGLWLGFPKLQPNPWEDLEFVDEGDARTAMTSALSGVRQLVEYNPDNRLPASLQTQVLWAAFAVSVVFGAVAQKTHFCTMGAISDIVNLVESVSLS